MDIILAQGAEATLTRKGDIVFKSRIPKSYRIPQIDNTLRLSRTRKEIKALKKAKEIGVSVPNLHSSPDKYTVVMDYIDGKRLRDVAVNEEKTVLDYFIRVGKQLALLHDAGLIHGDLTTSNIMIAEKLYFIDFGLSFFSGKIEDMAVDIHVLEEALESTHYLYATIFFKSFLKGYSSCSHYEKILERLNVVRLRGKNK